jgi:hypothetical protein
MFFVIYVTTMERLTHRRVPQEYRKGRRCGVVRNESDEQKGWWVHESVAP